MNINKVSIITSIIIIILLIGIPTTWKIINNHYDKLYRVVNSKIIENAKKCYYEEVCTTDRITLEFLYEHNYLEKMSNPVTKEYYNINSYVERIDQDFKFVVVE